MSRQVHEELLTDFSYGQTFKHNLFGTEFKVVGYKITTNGTIYLLGQVKLVGDAVEYENQYRTEQFPIIQCSPVEEMRKGDRFVWPKIAIGSMVSLPQMAQGTMYLVLGAKCDYINKVNLILMHQHLTPSIIEMPEDMVSMVKDMSSFTNLNPGHTCGDRFRYIYHPVFKQMEELEEEDTEYAPTGRPVNLNPFSEIPFDPKKIR